MSVYKDEAHNSWYCKFRYTDWQGNKKETTKRGFKTKREAKEYEETTKSEAQGMPSITVDQLIEVFLCDVKTRRRTSSYVHLSSNFKNHISAHLGKKIVSQITPLTIKKWQAEIDKKGLKPSTIHNINVDFAMLLNYAVKHYNLICNPFDKVKKNGVIESRKDFWTLEEFNRVIEVTDDIYYNLALKLLFYSGMRIGEMFALHVEDMDFTNNTLSITKTYVELTKEDNRAKTECSMRVISMPDSVMKQLREYLDSFIEIPERPLFYRTRSIFQKNIDRYTEKAGVKRIVAHNLRHSHATYLIQKGVPITAISKRLGHSSTSITLDVYSHVYKENDHEIADLLETSLKNQ